MQEIHCVVSGVVQGVSFRVYLQDSATSLELTGWVRNMSDGTVEVLAQGSADTLKDFVEYIHEGSLRSKVEAVAVDWQTAKKMYDEFSILYD